MCLAAAQMLVTCPGIILEDDMPVLQAMVRQTLADPAYAVRRNVASLPVQILQCSHAKIQVGLDAICNYSYRSKF